jgi:hypothetical protein
MSMFVRTAAVALVALGLWATQSPAQDLGAKVFRLGDQSAFADDDEDDTQLVHRRGYGGGYGRGYGGGYGRGYGGGYGGFRSYYGGFRHYGGYGGYRSYYGGYYPRVNFSFNYYRPYYGGYRYYSPPVYYYYPSYSSYYYPCAGDTVLNGGFGSAPRVPYQPVEPMTKPRDEDAPGGTPMPSAPPIPREEGTFPYDGGPGTPVPMPSAEPQPQKAKPIDPSQGRIVSLPARSTRFVYPAYGEKTPPPAFASDRPTLVKDDPAKAPRR